MWAYGGALWDPTTYTAEGYVNSPEADGRSPVHARHGGRRQERRSGQRQLDDQRAAGHYASKARRRWPSTGWRSSAAPPTTRPSSLVRGQVRLRPSAEGTAESGRDVRLPGLRASTPALEHKEIAWQYLQWLMAQEQQQAIMDEIGAGFQSPRKDLKDAGQYPWQQVIRRAYPDRARLLEHPGVRAAVQLAADAA